MMTVLSKWLVSAKKLRKPYGFIVFWNPNLYFCCTVATQLMLFAYSTTKMKVWISRSKKNNWFLEVFGVREAQMYTFMLCF